MPRTPAAPPQGRLFLLEVTSAPRRSAQAGGARSDADRRAWARQGDLRRDFRRSLGLGLRGQRNLRDALAQRMRFRRKTFLPRLDGSAAPAEELPDDGLKAAVSVSFQETPDPMRLRLAEAAPVRVLHGRRTAAETKAERRRFRGGDARIRIFTPEEGVSLRQGEAAGDDAPRARAIRDVRRSAIRMQRIEGRTHRDGRPAPACRTFAPDAIDERILEAVPARLRTMQGDGTPTTRAIEEAPPQAPP
jgi:hypothetical protein